MDKVQLAESVHLANVHYTRSFWKTFLTSFSDPISELLICSPYFGKLPGPFENIVKFCEYQLNRGVEKIRIVTPPPTKQESSLSIEDAARLVKNDIEVLIWLSPFLHAKVYHIEYRRGHFKSFVGSSNFTIGGLKRNHEVVAEIEGVGKKSPCHREIQRLVSGRTTVNYTHWLRQQMPAGTEFEI